MITVKNLNLIINDQLILDDLSFTIQKGKISIFIGKSGAGKTTFLKTIAGLYSIPENNIFLEDQDLSKLNESQRCKKIGFVFQNFNLFANMTVLENCTDPLLIQKISQQDADSKAKEILNLLDIVNLQHKYPSQLSGGQQQRVAIARALCLNPEIIILDEPTASLDPINTDGLVTILKNLVNRGITVITSSQDMSFVSKIFDQVFFMENGKIVEFNNDASTLSNSSKIQTFLQS